MDQTILKLNYLILKQNSSAKKIRIKILKARAENCSENKSNNILSIRNRKIFISTLKGEIECEIIQFENKKAMTAKDVLNGFKFSSNCYVN